jgi:hypothetical protein
MHLKLFEVHRVVLIAATRDFGHVNGFFSFKRSSVEDVEEVGVLDRL